MDCQISYTFGGASEMKTNTYMDADIDIRLGN